MFHWEINLNTCLAIFFGNHQSLKDVFYEGLSNIFTKNIVTQFNFSSIIIYSVNWFLTGFYWIRLKTLHKFSIISWQLNLSTCQFTFLEVTEQCLLSCINRQCYCKFWTLLFPALALSLSLSLTLVLALALALSSENVGLILPNTIFCSLVLIISKAIRSPELSLCYQNFFQFYQCLKGIIQQSIDKEPEITPSSAICRAMKA